MTISSNLSTVTRNGNGVATSFSFPFKVWDTSQLGVYITDPDGATTTTSNFTATLSGSGGNVVYPAAGGAVLPTGWMITIIRSMPFTQNVDLVNGQAFYPDVIEGELDQIIATCQQLNEGLTRAVKVDPGQSDPAVLLTQIQTAVTTSGSNATAAAGSATAASSSATSAAASATAAANAAANVTVRKYPTVGPLSANPGQTVITPGFTLDPVKDSTAVYIDGIKQARGTYTYTATDITLSEALVGGEHIEVFSIDTTSAGSTPLYAVNNLSDLADKNAAKANLGATSTPTAGAIPLADGNGFLDSWVSQQTKSATCSTAAATADKVAALANFSLATGSRVFITFSNTNTVAGALTLNVNSTGAKAIYDESGTAVSATNPAYFPSGYKIEFIYDGANWVYINRVATTYVNGTSWYKKHSNGWIEQGGSKSGIANTTATVVTLNTPFTGTNYTASATKTTSNYGSYGEAFAAVTAKAVSSITIYTNNTASIDWYACGF